jgi:small subunit ribosomal protein S6
MMTRKYEIGYIFNPEASEEDVKKFSDSLIGVIEKAKGKVENVDEWGRKPLAYPIDKHSEGIYTFINTDVEGSAIAELERRLKLSEKVMRFVIVRMDERLKRANKLTKRWTKLDRISKKSREASREAATKEEYRKEEGKEDKE